jgi:hypothetical protein
MERDGLLTLRNGSRDPNALFAFLDFELGDA